MQGYLVGGAVRDELLGRVIKERDYVVVGATPEQMLKPEKASRQEDRRVLPAARFRPH